MKRVLFGFLVLILIGCGKDGATVDGSDQVGFNQSLEKIKKELPTLQKEKFDEAVQLVFNYKTATESENRWSEVRTLLDGKTADEIFTLAEQIADENEISWNRNQAPYSGGLPTKKGEKEEDEPKEEEKDSPIKAANTVDLNVEVEGRNIHVYPNFLRYDGTLIRYAENLNNVLVEIFSNGTLVHSVKGTIETYRDADPQYGGDGIVIPLRYLRKERIKNENLMVKVRVPHPEKYLIQRAKINVPIEYVGFVEDTTVVVNNPDTIQKEEKKPQDKDEVISKSIAKRFLNNINQGKLNHAYGMTKNPKWTSFKSFSNEFENIENVENTNFRLISKNENQVKLDVQYNAKNNGTGYKYNYQYNYTLKNENGRWFIVDKKLVRSKNLDQPTQPEDIEKEEAESVIEIK